MLSFSATAERYNLLGSTYKRKAFVANTETQKLKAYEEAAYNYMMAHQKGTQVNEA
jgi:hypothetical protein